MYTQNCEWASEALLFPKPGKLPLFLILKVLEIEDLVLSVNLIFYSEEIIEHLKYLVLVRLEELKLGELDLWAINYRAKKPNLEVIITIASGIVKHSILWLLGWEL